ncbi:MAG: exonuclease subunit SbcD, partial [Prevotellaceae bacterium]|nr:exonuclease subunit SbcD [Prevotellaceae bacterium]
MILLHTSDWHLGRMLYSKKERSDEHAKFLSWLLDTVKKNAVDTLIVAGDIFDSAAPGNAAQKMYYDFLLGAHNCGCRNIVVVAGNHDSPSLLDAPKEILSALNIKIVGKITENPEDEIVVIDDENGETAAIICAVPFLRERDIIRFVEGEKYADRSKRIAENVRKHYETLAEIAENKRTETGKNIPVIATGHLSVAGGKRSDDDGVHDTYIGTIEMLGSDIFPKTFDYVALGHFHIPSITGDNNKIRYCGSPIPMGFGEAKQQKIAVLVDFEKDTITEIHIPCFQKLKSICGDKKFIFNCLSELKKQKESIWVEIIYEGKEVFPDLSVWVNELIANTKIEIIKLQNRQYLTEVLTQNDSEQSLNELD